MANAKKDDFGVRFHVKSDKTQSGMTKHKSELTVTGTMADALERAAEVCKASKVPVLRVDIRVKAPADDSDFSLG